MVLTLIACNNSEKNAEAAKKSVLDSVNAVNYASVVPIRSLLLTLRFTEFIESMVLCLSSLA